MWVFREPSGSDPYPAAYFTLAPPTTATPTHHIRSSTPGEQGTRVSLGGGCRRGWEQAQSPWDGGSEASGSLGEGQGRAWGAPSLPPPASAHISWDRPSCVRGLLGHSVVSGACGPGSSDRTSSWGLGSQGWSSPFLSPGYFCPLAPHPPHRFGASLGPTHPT